MKQKLTREWEAEPDYKEFKYKGYQCEIKRIEMFGYLCGYVHIPLSHPVYGKKYHDIDIECHGGLTYSNIDYQTKDMVIGFDCAHYMDIVPYYYDHHNSLVWIGAKYRNMKYLEIECKSIVNQLIAIKKKKGK